MTAALGFRGGGLPLAFGLLACVVGILAGINPPLAIGMALAVAFALMVFADLYVGVALFTLLTFVAQVPGLGQSSVTFSKFAGLLLAISWLAVITTRRHARADLLTAYPAVGFALIAFVAWMALSELWAESSSESLDAAFRIALNAILVLIIFTAVREPKHVIGVVAAFVAGATLDAVYGLLFVAPEGTEAAGRLAGGLDNPNELATVLVAAMALSLGLASALRGSPVMRVAAVAAGVVCTTGVFLTGSRGGLVALAVALIAFLLTGSRFRGRFLLVAVAVAAATIGYYGYVASPETRQRLFEDDSGSGRTDLWEIGWRMVESEPVTGIGAGNFASASPRFLLLEPGAIERSEFFIGDAPKVTHNTYLEIWAELGLVGLLLFLFILAFGLYAGAKATRQFAIRGDPRMEAVARSIFCAFAAVLAADFFGSRQYNKELWLLLGLAAAVLAISQTRDRESA